MSEAIVPTAYAPVFVVMLVALLEYFWFSIAVGRARYRYGVKAPATAGNADFVSPTWAAGLGVVFIVGRLLYFLGYVKAADKRSIGFGLSMFPTLALLIGGLVGAARAMLV